MSDSKECSTCTANNCPAIAMLGVHQNANAAAVKNEAGEVDLLRTVKALGSVDLGRALELFRKPENVFEILRDPSKAEGLFGGSSVARAGIMGAKLATYSATCSSRESSPETRQPSEHCIDTARQMATEVRPLPENHTLPDEVVHAISLAGITEEALRTPLPQPEA